MQPLQTSSCAIRPFFSFFPAHSGRYHRSPSLHESSPTAASNGDRARSPGAPMPVAIPLNHLEVAVHKTYSRYEMGPTSHQVSFVVAGGEPHNTPVARPVPDEEGTTRAS